jgi:predicted dehydrogenase
LFCEKPMATTVAACESLARTAEKSGVSLATGFNLRFLRAAVLARQLFDDGAIGELDHVRAFHGYSGAGGIPLNWMRDPAMSGGGSLMDNGIHIIDLCRWFLGDVQECTGFATGHVLQIPGCADNGFLLMKSSEGRVGALQSSWVEWRGYGYRVEVYGSEGFLRFGYPPMYLVHGQCKAHGKVRTKRYWFPIYQVVERIRGWQWGLVQTLVAELSAWATAILNRAEPPVNGKDGLEAVRIATSAERIPIQDQRPVAIEH